jgi:hypothetical protein
VNDRIVIGTLAPPQRSEDSPTYRGRVIGFDALLAQGEPTWWGPGLVLVVKHEREINPKLYSVTQKTFSKITATLGRSSCCCSLTTRPAR